MDGKQHHLGEMKGEEKREINQWACFEQQQQSIDITHERQTAFSL